MGTGQSKDPNQGKQKLSAKQITKLNLKPLIKKLQQRFLKYRKENVEQSQNSELIILQQEIRNIYMGLIKEKIMLANQNKISMKECKIEIAQQMLQVQITILKYVEFQLRGQENVDLIKNFYSNMGNFLVTLARFLKTIYPRGQNVEAGQLAKEFKEFDNTEEYQFDILKNANVVFSSPNQFDITNTIKLFLNKIMDQLDTHFGGFFSMIEKIDPAFKIGRKISQNTSRYVKLDTGTVQIKSTQVARVLIKWMQDLSQTLNDAQQKITPKNEYKFYKTFSQSNRIQFSKCEEQSLTKILNGGLIYCLDQQKGEAKKKADQRKSKFRKFNMHLIQVFNEVQHKQSEVSRQMMEVIKYSAFNNNFIAWMVEEELIQSIIHLIEASSEYQQFRGILDLIKFKINDLMRCQIFGDRKKIMAVYREFQRLESQDVIQIVKIKNRFSTPMSDAMLFFKLPKSFIVCECQLILSEQSKGEDAKKAKNIETLNHFLYELERSPFGVLGEISVFLTAKSQTVSSYCQKINLSITNTKKIDQCLKEHGSFSKSSKKKFKQQKSPFVCSKCLLFFKKFENKLKTHYCQKCIIFLCNGCMGEKFQITEEMICNTLERKLETCEQDVRKTRIYRANPAVFEEAFRTITPLELIENCFIRKKINQVSIIKDSLKNNKIKVSAIIDYIHSKEDYVKIYMEKGVKVNFVIITWRGEQTRLKCYRYDNDEGCICNVFQPIQKYETHEFIEVNDYDIFAEFASGGFCGLAEKNRDASDGFEMKVRSQLQKGLYIFQGQTKQTMISILQSIPQEQRHKYILKSHAINNELSMIIDIDHSLKRSDQADKIKEYLEQISKNNQQKKLLKMTDMNINNTALKNLRDHTKWTKNVKNLIISDNNISSIGVILELCTNLEKLNISRNRFRQLRFKTALPSLVELDASQNSISKVINLYNVRKIQSLNFKSNKLSQLTRWIDGKKKSKTQKGFSFLSGIQSSKSNKTQPEEKSFFSSIFSICQNSGVQETGFGDAYFEDEVIDSDEEYDLVEVKSFTKDKNGAYIYLRQLLLANNQFETMKEFSEGYFPNLTYLDLSDNLIEEIPEMNLDKIQQIHLANNCVKKLEKFAKSENSSLLFLDLKNNRIKDIPRFNFHLLTKVDFSYNCLEKNSDFIMGDYYENLTHLHLSHMRVQNLSNLPKSLKILSIQNSDLTDLQLQSFIKEMNLPKLRQLYLTRNKLTKLPNIEPLQKITALFLEENPIVDISAIQVQQHEERVKSQQEIKLKEKEKKKKDEGDQENKLSEFKKVGLYYYVNRLWLSLNFENNAKFRQTNKKIQTYLTNTKVVCWKYDGTFGQSIQKPKRKFFLHQQHQQTIFKQLMIKRHYLLNVFEHQVEINNRFQLQQQSEHQWDNIDMNEFIKYDWNEIDYIDLRGAGMDDKKWTVFSKNAYLFPALKQIQIWQHKITTISTGDLELFKNLEKISFYESNAWSNPLSQQSKQVLREYQKSHPNVKVKFQEEENLNNNSPIKQNHQAENNSETNLSKDNKRTNALKMEKSSQKASEFSSEKSSQRDGNHR